MPDATSIAEVTTIAAPIAMNVWNSISDFVIILVMVLVFVMFSRYVGRGPFVGVILSFYTAYALYIAFPYMGFLPTAPAITAVAAHAGLYLGLVAVFYIIMRRVVVSDFLYIGSLGLILLSFAAAAFLIALAYQLFDISTVYRFTPAINMLFAPKEYFFWWFLAPTVGLFIFAK
ncbi:hypothetical protein KGM48_02235 [Patescibacteria group bacterium]|nr:hypothetical protein [Patescibacteria group bacterium]